MGIRVQRRGLQYIYEKFMSHNGSNRANPLVRLVLALRAGISVHAQHYSRAVLVLALCPLRRAMFVYGPCAYSIFQCCISYDT